MRCVVALFKDETDACLWEVYLDGISTVLCFTADSTVSEKLERLHRSEARPGLVILSTAVYAANPALVSQVRRSFPDAEVLVVFSSQEAAPPMPLLLRDRVRHLALTPGSGDRAERGYLASVLQRLVSGRAWDIEACLAQQTPIISFSPSSSEEKEAVIEAVETAIAGENAEHELLRQRGALLADELLENALYGAPRGADGGKLFHKGDSRTILPEERIRFRFGFDGTTLALEMTDGWGTLSPEQVMEYLSRNHSIAEGDLDGGRGLFIIWRFFDHFHVSITPGEKTVICGDLRIAAAPDPEAPRGFHISTHKKEVQDAVQ